MFKLRKTLSHLFNRTQIDEALFESLEESLILADVGMNATQKLILQLRHKVKQLKLTDSTLLKQVLQDLITELLTPLEYADNPLVHLDSPVLPEIWLIVGVNGAGKTTSIGKICFALQKQGKNILLAAGDTFRAAAKEQLMAWGQKNNVSVIQQASGDASTVAHDAVTAAISRKVDVLVIDTAGRLATQTHLMDELKKIKRVITKLLPGAPHQVLLVLDGNTGQNAVAQVKAFHEALGLTSLLVSKIDGTAKGGVLCAIAELFKESINPPKIMALGVGEGIEEIEVFNSKKFSSALLYE